MAEEPKSGDDGPIKPQIIDLEAEDVTADPAADGAQAETEQIPAAAPRGGMAKWIVAALVAGVLAGGWLYRDLLSAYLPTNAMTALQDRIDALEANNKTVSEQLLAVSQSADKAADAVGGLGQSIKTAAGDVAQVRGSMSTLEARVAAAETAAASLKSDIEKLRVAVSSGTAGGVSGGDGAALLALTQRVEALEKEAASLGGGTGSNVAVAELSQALSDIKAKIASGAAYKDEYERIARMVPAAAGLDVLAAHAEAGIPNAKGLAGELRGIIPTLPSPEAGEAPAGSGWFDAVLDSLSGIITIRPIGEADWHSLAEKCAALAEEGDLAQAIGVIDASEGSKPAALVQWRDLAAARLKLEAALEEVAEAVLRQIAALGGTP